MTTGKPVSKPIQKAFDTHEHLNGHAVTTTTKPSITLPKGAVRDTTAEIKQMLDTMKAEIIQQIGDEVSRIEETIRETLSRD